MTTHKAHVSLFYNQCLALQTIAILLERAGSDRNARAAWVYEHAARWILPDLYEGQDERPMPGKRGDFLPKVMLAERCEIDEDPTLVNMRRTRETLTGGYLCTDVTGIERDPFAKERRR